MGPQPQHWAVPPTTAQAAVGPTETWLAPTMPTTSTGTLLDLEVPSPSWPEPLSPQQRRAPPFTTAHAEYQPAATLCAAVMFFTLTGASRVVRVPSPSCPT